MSRAYPNISIISINEWCPGMMSKQKYFQSSKLKLNWLLFHSFTPEPNHQIDLFVSFLLIQLIPSNLFTTFIHLLNFFFLLLMVICYYYCMCRHLSSCLDHAMSRANLHICVVLRYFMIITDELSWREKSLHVFCFCFYFYLLHWWCE